MRKVTLWKGTKRHEKARASASWAPHTERICTKSCCNLAVATRLPLENVLKVHVFLPAGQKSSFSYMTISRNAPLSGGGRSRMKISLNFIEFHWISLNFIEFLPKFDRLVLGCINEFLNFFFEFVERVLLIRSFLKKNAKIRKKKREKNLNENCKNHDFCGFFDFEVAQKRPYQRVFEVFLRDDVECNQISALVKK